MSLPFCLAGYNKVFGELSGFRQKDIMSKSSGVKSSDATFPAKVNIASNEMRYTLVPRLSYFLSFKEWDRLLQASGILHKIMHDHTTVQYTLDGRQVSLFRWGTADGKVPRLYISLPNVNVSRSFGWKGSTTGDTFWHKIRCAVTQNRK